MQPGSTEIVSKPYSSPLSQIAVNKVEEIKNLILDLAHFEKVNLDEKAELKEQLNVYKIAFNDHKTLLVNSKLENEALENQIKLYQGHRIVTILDGDGAIFSPSLINQGTLGGREAARILCSGVLEYVKSNYGPNQYQLSVFIFLNKRGLRDTLGRTGHVIAKQQLGNFLRGFNQATERFLVVDVGDGKEVADAKVKTHLEDTIQFPQTCKVVFGGCHDNGYATSLRSHITAGFKEKLILLKSYEETATDIAALNLPLLTIPNLFLPEKLLNPPCTPPGLNSRISPPSGLSFESLPTGPTDYSRAVRAGRRIPTPELDSNCSTTSEDESPDVYLPPTSQKRHLTPGLPLSKHKPPPCTMFYLANCKFGQGCKYGHDYLLDAEGYEELKQNAKKKPCPSTNQNEFCGWGDSCCYGHYCPNATKCVYQKLGKCNFKGADMHKEPKVEATGL